MRIERVRFKDYCQHEKLDEKLGPGVIGILGPNGSGKSNLVKGIKRAFTGETDNVGKNEDDVRWGAESGNLQVDFAIGGVHGHIKRNLGSSVCSMEFGSDKLRKATDIDGKIFKVLGVSSKVLSDIVFIAQGQIETLLFQRPAERAKALQALFRTEDAETIRALLLEDMGTIIMQSQQSTLDQKRAQVQTITGQVAQISEAITFWTPKYLTPEQVAKFSKGASDRQSAILRTSAMEGLRADITRFDITYNQCTIAAETAKKKVIESEQTLKEFEADYKAAKQSLATASSVTVIAQQIDRYQSTIAWSEEALKAPAPAVAIAFDKIEEVEQQIRDLLPAVRNATEVVHLAQTGHQICPTCHQPVQLMFVHEQRCLLDGEGVRLKNLEESVRLMRSSRTNYELAKVNYENGQALAKQKIAEAHTELAKLPAVTAPSKEKLATDQEIVNVYEQTNSVLSANTSALSAANTSAAGWKAHLDQAKARLAEYESVATEPVPSAEEVADMNQKLIDHQKATTEMATMKERMSIFSGQLDTLKKEVELLDAKEKTLEDAKRYVDLAERARQLFHRDHLPNMVAQGFIRMLNQKLANYIEMFQVPFTAKMEPDYSMRCTFGNRVAVAERLSGGQKVMLGIAFRFAIYDCFVNDLGLMVLDEPTVSLDNDRIESVVKLLSRVKSYSQAAGLQLIVVTHEPRLQGVFDQVIKLGSK